MSLPKLNSDHLLIQELPQVEGWRSTVEERSADILRQVQNYQRDWKDRRREKTDKMLECWAAYFNTPEAIDWMRQNALKRTVGDKTVDWRHKLSSAKAYDIVETIVPYLKAATFPNREWFDMQPRMPIEDEDYRTYMKVMKTFFNYKLDEANFKSWYEICLRQAVITGTSILAMPWRIETRCQKKNVKVRTYEQDSVRVETVEKTIYNAPSIGVEDMLDTFLDPDANNPNDAALIRRMVFTRAEMARMVENESYDLIDIDDIRRLKPLRASGKTDEQMQMATWHGTHDGAETHPADTIEVFEYWGNLEISDIELYDVVVTWAGDKLLRVETNPYWGGKPFVVMTYTPVMNSPYGIGAIEPVLSLLHEKDSIKNQRLDGLELSINPMWGMVPDGTLQAEEVTAEPGKVLQLASRDSLFPLSADLNFVGVAINEETTLEQEVDRRTGTGSFIGSGAARSGERVTAQEIIALREAGGNRLSGIHAHIEENTLLPFIQRAYEYMQQFVVADEVVPVQGRSADEVLYALVGIDQLQHDMRLRPVGADHVADREFELRQRADWMALVNSNPTMAENVNWLEVLKDITERFVGEDAERFISEAQPAPQGDPATNEAVESARATGGEEMANAVQAQVMADGGQNLQAAMQSLAPPAPVF